MPAALDLSLLPEPLRALVQSVLVEREQVCAERAAARQQRDDWAAE